MVCFATNKALLLSDLDRQQHEGQLRNNFAIKKKMISVRFDPQPSKNNKRRATSTSMSTPTPTSTSTWLSPQEYGSIRRNVERTIMMFENTPETEQGMVSPNFCRRGLENFYIVETTRGTSTSIATCLKPNVHLRRKIAILDVLEEQAAQRTRQQEQERGCYSHNFNDDDSDSDSEGNLLARARPRYRYHHGALRRATLSRSNRENVMISIEKGLKDAALARVVYAEDPMGQRRNRKQKRQREHEPRKSQSESQSQSPVRENTPPTWKRQSV